MKLPTTSIEELHWQRNTLVAGVDEAGRGALAGPVVAGAVILPMGFLAHDTALHRVRDSKTIPENEREELFERIQHYAIAWSVGIISAKTIDSVNILQATFLAMKKAVETLSIQPAHLLIDGNRFVNYPIPWTTIIKGDSESLSIACASIIAKVTRDRMMRELDTEFPEYGFLTNKGYGTALHRNAITTHGETPEHRSTFLSSVYSKQEVLF
jgi:ribonuclease HII